MYEIAFPGEMTVPDQPPCEFSQDLGHTERLLEIGEKVFFKPNAAKINLFTHDQMTNCTSGKGIHEN